MNIITAVDINTDAQLLAQLGYSDAFIAKYVAEHTATHTLESVVSVIRKYRCQDCGHRHNDGVEVTLDEAIAKPQTVVGYWACNECGSEYWDNIRVVARDLKI